MTTAASLPLSPDAPPGEVPRRFDLLEVMRHDAHEGVIDLPRHLDRLKASAEALGFRFDRHDARNELQAATFGAGHSQVRLLLAPSGAVAVEVRPLPPRPQEPVPVALAPRPIPRDDIRLRHRTSDQAPLDEARARTGAFEVLFTDVAGLLAGGSFTTLFVEREEMLLTPPLERGIRPGIVRSRLIEEGRAVEANLTAADLAQGFLIGNAVYGLLKASLA